MGQKLYIKMSFGWDKPFTAETPNKGKDMRFINKNGSGFGILIESKDQELGRILSMIVACIIIGFLVGVVAIGLGIASLWVVELRDWPIGKAGVGVIAALWFWCVVIYPVYYWFRYIR